MNRAQKLIYGVLGSLLVMLVISCGSKQPLPTDEERQEARKQVPCVVVLPVVTDIDGDSSKNYQEAAVLEKGAAFMDTLIAEELVGDKHVRVLSERQLTSLIPQDSSSRLALMKKVGSVLKCEGVMVTTLSRFQQRVGGAYGVDVPASVSFSMRLFGTSDGRVIWAGQFDETQQSLLSNILAGAKRGFTWITVEELTRQGIKETIIECPYL